VRANGAGSAGLQSPREVVTQRKTKEQAGAGDRFLATRATVPYYLAYHGGSMDPAGSLSAFNATPRSLADSCVAVPRSLPTPMPVAGSWKCTGGSSVKPYTRTRSTTVMPCVSACVPWHVLARRYWPAYGALLGSDAPSPADGVMCAMQVRKASLHLPTDHFTLAVVTAVTVGCGQRAHTFGLCGCRALTRRCRLS